MAKPRKTTTITCSECGETGARGKGSLCLSCYQNQYKAMQRLIKKRSRAIRISEDV